MVAGQLLGFRTCICIFLAASKPAWPLHW